MKIDKSLKNLMAQGVIPANKSSLLLINKIFSEARETKRKKRILYMRQLRHIRKSNRIQKNIKK